MALNRPLDLVDLKEQLQFRNNLVQVKGFSTIVDRISNRVLDQRNDGEYRKVLFDCFHEFGGVPFELLMETLPVFIEKQLMSTRIILDEFTIRLTKIKHMHRAFPIILEICKPSYQEFLSLASKIDAGVLTEVCRGKGFQWNYWKYVLVLLFTDILTDEQKQFVGNGEYTQKIFVNYFPHLYPLDQKATFDTEQFLRECSHQELVTYPLAQIDVFTRYRLMRDRPSILQNPSIGSHVLFMPYMYTMIPYRPLEFGMLEENKKKVREEADKMRAQIFDCQDKIIFAPPDFYEQVLNMENFMSHITLKKKIPSFVRFIENNTDWLTMFRKPHILACLCSLISHSRKEPEIQQRLMRLLCTFVKDVPEEAEIFALYFCGLFAKPIFDIDQRMIMDTLVDLALHLHALPAIQTFFCVYIQVGETRDKAFECLCRLVRKFPKIIPKVVSTIMMKLKDEESEDIHRASINCLKECCLATEQNDDILKIISNVVKGPSTALQFAAAVDAIKELVEHDVVDLSAVRKQLTRRVKLEGNEVAFAGYCRILALGNAQYSDENDKDYSEEATKQLKKDCIKDLHEFTKHSNHGVASEAWRALGEYQLSDIEETLNVSPLSFCVEYVKIHEEQRDGFVDFLNKFLEHEKESYNRPLYNVGIQTADVPVLLSKVDTFKDHLIIKHKNETWFWNATLPLTAFILQLTAASNKVATAIQLTKSCLLNIPPATCHDEMLRHVAGWRICIREVLNVLAESKNNDLLWARDQICQQGRLCLTQKTESVDNIMMMLTVLAEVIEEKLRFIDDGKQVGEVTKAQKPWILSVFEFIATRLPKGVKEKRMQKVTPIYQIVTHSNKSSLFTAIFCTRLLYRNPCVLEYYHNESELGLKEDPLFISLLQDSTNELEQDNIPSRDMLWITAEAYGADEMTANAFEERHQQAIIERTEKFEKPSLEINQDVGQFFNALVVSPKSELDDIQESNRKVLEKLWNNGAEEVRRKIYEGLSELALISGIGRKRKVVSLEKLSDSSVLKSILKMFDKKQAVEPAVLRNLLRSFVNHKRRDGRFLPPIDWMKMLERAEWKKADPESRLAIIRLACEQKISEVIFHFSENLTVQELLVVSEHLRSVSELVPRKEFLLILDQIIVQARKDDEDRDTSKKLAAAIAKNEKNPIVHLSLVKHLPKLIKTIEVTDPILKALKEPNEFAGKISLCFDVWLEARNGEKMNVKRICDLFNSEENILRKQSICALVSLEARRLSIKMRIEKILDIITASRITRSESGDMAAFFTIFLSIIVSPIDEVDIPLCWFENEPDIIPMMGAARRHYFRLLVDSPEIKNSVKNIGSFLRPYIEGDEADFYEMWQKETAADFLAMLIAIYPTDTLPNLLHENDDFWPNLIPLC